MSKQLKEPVNKTDWRAHGAPTTVNAYYADYENSIRKLGVWCVQDKLYFLFTLFGMVYFSFCFLEVHVVVNVVFSSHYTLNIYLRIWSFIVIQSFIFVAFIFRSMAWRYLRYL